MRRRAAVCRRAGAVRRRVSSLGGWRRRCRCSSPGGSCRVSAPASSRRSVRRDRARFSRSEDRACSPSFDLVVVPGSSARCWPNRSGGIGWRWVFLAPAARGRGRVLDLPAIVRFGRCRAAGDARFADRRRLIGERGRRRARAGPGGFTAALAAGPGVVGGVLVGVGPSRDFTPRRRAPGPLPAVVSPRGVRVRLSQRHVACRSRCTRAWHVELRRRRGHGRTVSGPSARGSRTDRSSRPGEAHSYVWRTWCWCRRSSSSPWVIYPASVPF